MDLYLARHTQSMGNVANIIDDNSINSSDKNGLSDLGKEQAKELAMKLEKYRFDIIVISKFKRTKETIDPYVRNHKVKVVVSDVIGERNAGIFAGKPKTAMKDYCLANSITDRVSWRPDKGESLLEVYQRAKKFISYLKTNFGNKSVLVVGHTNFLRCLDIAIRNSDIMDFYSGKELEHGEIKHYKL
ncbi:histidine phosphatase family protein [Candidatus Pacearchaeota archaeon]|nr:histidine phosphatase family protein [Candidatus Pacearchaeota archaeon]